MCEVQFWFILAVEGIGLCCYEMRCLKFVGFMLSVLRAWFCISAANFGLLKVIGYGNMRA